MREIEATYLIHRDEEGYPPTFLRFAPGEDPQRVVFSTPRYAIFDELEDGSVEFSNDWDELEELLVSMREESDDGDGDRFWAYDAHEDTYGVEWFSDYKLGARWHSSNAWRGYEEPTYSDELEPFASGWITGYPDETVTYKRVTEHLFADLINGDLEPPFEVFWFIGVTSNVFSQSSDILVPAGKSDEFSLWLDGLDGYDSEGMTHAFN